MGRRRSTGPIVLRRPEQLRAVTSTVAHQIVSVMERVRRATVSELAHEVGLPAASLYYHVRKLRRAGVLAPAEKRATAGRDEVVWELTGSEVILDPTAGGPRFLAELGRNLRARLRAVERGMLDALGRPGTIRHGRGKNLSLHQHHARLSAAKRAELYRRVDELEAFLVENDDPRQEGFTHVTVAILPVARASGD
jgi:DNA-binding Lrp family transcriptional regulator